MIHTRLPFERDPKNHLDKPGSETLNFIKSKLIDPNDVDPKKAGKPLPIIEH